MSGPRIPDAIAMVVSILTTATYNVFGGTLPAGWDPSADANGHAFVVTIKGGTSEVEMPIKEFHVQLDCWGGQNEFVSVWAQQSAVSTLLESQDNKDFGLFGYLMTCVEINPGQTMYDQTTGWVRVVSSYTLRIR